MKEGWTKGSDRGRNKGREEGKKGVRVAGSVKKHSLLENLNLRAPESLPGYSRLPKLLNKN